MDGRLQESRKDDNYQTKENHNTDDQTIKSETPLEMNTKWHQSQTNSTNCLENDDVQNIAEATSPIKEEVGTDQMAIKTEQEETQENMLEPIVTSEIDESKDVLTFDKNGILQKYSIDKSNGAKRVPCQFCKKTFSRKTHLTVHERIHTGEKPYQCEVCDKGFIDKSALTKHTEYKHSTGKKYQCSECGKEAASAGALKYHKLSVHSNTSVIKCEDENCDKIFQRKDQLTAHMRIHSSESIPCHLCGKEFKIKANLQRHLETHLGIKKFQCVDCGKLFPSGRNLRQHVSIVHLQNNEVFPCHLCDKQFNTKCNLQSHISSHIGMKNHQCVDCGKLYRTDRSLQQHMKIVHLGQKEYQCQECEKSFTRISSLKVHKLTHTNETPYKCEYCSQGYKEKRNLMKHIEKFHQTEIPVKSEDIYNYGPQPVEAGDNSEDKDNLMSEDCLN